MCDPILVTLLKIRLHYSQSSRENVTPSSGTSPLVSFKKCPPPPGNEYEFEVEEGERKKSRGFCLRKKSAEKTDDYVTFLQVLRCTFTAYVRDDDLLFARASLTVVVKTKKLVAKIKGMLLW